MRLPMRAFWAMLDSIRRIEAEKDRRALLVATAAQSADGAKQLLVQLTEEIGVVVQQDPTADVFDSDGWAELKRMAMGA